MRGQQYRETCQLWHHHFAIDTGEELQAGLHAFDKNVPQWSVTKLHSEVPAYAYSIVIYGIQLGSTFP